MSRRMSSGSYGLARQPRMNREELSTPQIVGAAPALLLLVLATIGVTPAEAKRRLASAEAVA